MGPSLVLGLVSAVCTVHHVRGGFLFCLLYLLQNLQGSAQTFGEVRSDTLFLLLLSGLARLACVCHFPSGLDGQFQ